MKIRLNGEEAETGATNLQELINMLGYHEEAKLATAVNGEFVPATGRADQKLKADDEVEIVAPRQGG